MLSCLPVQGISAGEGKELNGEAPEHGSKPSHALAWVVAVSLLRSSTERIYGGGKRKPKKVALWDTSKMFCLIPGNDQRLAGQGPEQSHIVGGIYTHGKRVRTRQSCP